MIFIIGLLMSYGWILSGLAAFKKLFPHFHDIPCSVDIVPHLDNLNSDLSTKSQSNT